MIYNDNLSKSTVVNQKKKKKRFLMKIWVNVFVSEDLLGVSVHEILTISMLLIVICP